MKRNPSIYEDHKGISNGICANAFGKKMAVKCPNGDFDRRLQNVTQESIDMDMNHRFAAQIDLGSSNAPQRACLGRISVIRMTNNFYANLAYLFILSFPSPSVTLHSLESELNTAGLLCIIDLSNNACVSYGA